ncbi:hypothetical protein ACFVIM_17935 [Streptomyces sp. NPDC057638]|uniref:hypothetical protein n=1 Tax=Streptomyces sp. NPDC057638 TaxID=3346190 RepID=UPI00368DECF5
MNERVFEPSTGDGPPPAAGGRAEEVRTAYEGLQRIRTLTGAASRPADWERHRPVRAVALALEAAGVEPSAVDGARRRTATGYRVSAGDRPGTVRVEWLGPPGSGAAWEEERRLRGCADALEAAGWEPLLYKGPRGRRYLEVEPGGG